MTSEAKPWDSVVFEAWHEYRYPQAAIDPPTDRFMRAARVFQAASRAAVAAELDRISPELTSAVCSKTDEWDAGWWAALDWVGQQLGRRASELRSEGKDGDTTP